MFVAQSVFRKEGGINIKVILIGVISGVLLIGLGTWILYACRKKFHAQPTEEGKKIAQLSDNGIFMLNSYE